VIEIHDDGAFLRVDGQGLDALVAGDDDAAAAQARSPELVTAFREVRAQPLFWFELVTAGADSVLVHRGWVDDEVMGLQLALDESRWQVMVDAPDFLAAALARLVEVNPSLRSRDEAAPYAQVGLGSLTDQDDGVRREALASVGADMAWRLTCETDAAEWHVTAVDGASGPAVYSREGESFEPTTNTELFWLFATVREELMSP